MPSKRAKKAAEVWFDKDTNWRDYGLRPHYAEGFDAGFKAALEWCELQCLRERGTLNKLAQDYDEVGEFDTKHLAENRAATANRLADIIRRGPEGDSNAKD